MTTTQGHRRWLVPVFAKEFLRETTTPSRRGSEREGVDSFDPAETGWNLKGVPNLGSNSAASSLIYLVAWIFYVRRAIYAATLIIEP